MTFNGLTKICLSRSLLQLKHGNICPGFVPAREFKKHWDQKWRKLRAQKVLKIELPDYEKHKRESTMDPQEQREHYKREGIEPPRKYQERDLLLTCTNSIFEAYVPPEGDGVASLVSGQGAKQRVTGLEKKGKSYMNLRKIRKFEEFDTKEFPQIALDIYKEAHDLLHDVDKNKDRLHELVTEKTYPEMTWRLEKKTYRWKYIKGLEPPRVVHVRTTTLMSKENMYAQVTVRFHTQQTLAIYDRFGRLTFGSEHMIKDCLEYVVFEKHISDENSAWRIHGKVIPDWLPKTQGIIQTLRMKTYTPSPDDEAKAEKEDTKSAVAV